MIVLVTGSRVLAGRDADDLVRALDRLDIAEGVDPTCAPGIPAIGMVVAGCALGADRIALQWGAAWGRRVMKFDAYWRARGKRAGPERNERMVAWCASRAAAGEHVLCLVAPGGAGTADCARRARAVGLRVLTVSEALLGVYCHRCEGFGAEGCPDCGGTGRVPLAHPPRPAAGDAAPGPLLGPESDGSRPEPPSAGERRACEACGHDTPYPDWRYCARCAASRGRAALIIDDARAASLDPVHALLGAARIAEEDGRAAQAAELRAEAEALDRQMPLDWSGGAPEARP